MKDFLTSARPDMGAINEENAIEFEHWDTPVKFYEPSDGQQVMMLSMGGRQMSQEAAGIFIQLWINLGDDDTQRYFRDLLLDRESGFGLMTPGGIFDIWESLMEEWSGKASEPAPESPSPRRTTGRASTGSSRAKASASSTSRSRASST